MTRIRRIAAWSGPRNLSTAMMRAWESRPDTTVCDEPLYAHYLRATGVEHPGREEIIARCETDWRVVVRMLIGPVPEDRPIFYQKHMAHHLLPEIDRSWLDRLTHVFLIRDPAEMLVSLDKIYPDPRIEDTGLLQQVEVYERCLERSGTPPPVVDARDVLEHPEAMLRRLCEALDVEFSTRMLRWRRGRRDTDGIWARRWYASVERSTGFGPYRPRREAVPERLRGLHVRALEPYRYLHGRRLRP